MNPVVKKVIFQIYDQHGEQNHGSGLYHLAIDYKVSIHGVLVWGKTLGIPDRLGRLPMT